MPVPYFVQKQRESMLEAEAFDANRKIHSLEREIERLKIELKKYKEAEAKK